MSTLFFSNHSFSIGDRVFSISRLFFGVGEARVLVDLVLFQPQPELGIVLCLQDPLGSCLVE